MQQLYGIILAGGAGTRFWPLSRRTRPKQLLPLLDGRTTLEVTVERLTPLIPRENLMVVTNRQQADASAAILSRHLDPGQIVPEPQGRNTAPAIALAAELLRRKGGEEAIMMVFPADHFIAEKENFHRHLLRAAECASDGSLVTLGIKPNRPETGYGYIQAGAPLPDSSTIPELSACRVARFVEKPDYRTAAAYLMDGSYFWNSGIFVWQVGSILREIAALTPDLDRALESFRQNSSQLGDEKAMDRFYARVESISIDFAIIEKSSRVAMVPAAFPWSDLGSWDSLDELGLTPFAVPSRIISYGATDNTIFSRRLTALVEVENLLVIESDDALLICRKGSSQQVREVVSELQRRGLVEYL